MFSVPLKRSFVHTTTHNRTVIDTASRNLHGATFIDIASGIASARVDARPLRDDDVMAAALGTSLQCLQSISSVARANILEEE